MIAQGVRFRCVDGLKVIAGLDEALFVSFLGDDGTQISKRLTDQYMNFGARAKDLQARRSRH